MKIQHRLTTFLRCRWNRRTEKEFKGWGRHREQGRANKTDVGQLMREVGREKQAEDRKLKTQLKINCKL